MKLLAFAASLRKGSFNRKLIAQFAEAAKGMPGVALDLADYRDFEMPIYDGDVEETSGIPSGAKELIRRVRAADALVISTPEYNGGMAGTLKNALDWASREKPICFEDKPLLLIGASPGGYGSVRGLWHTRVPFEAIGTLVYPEMFGLARAHEAFNGAGGFVDSRNSDRLKELAAAYVSYARALTQAETGAHA